jgi:hypothetical protein
MGLAWEGTWLWLWLFVEDKRLSFVYHSFMMVLTYRGMKISDSSNSSDTTFESLCPSKNPISTVELTAAQVSLWQQTILVALP